MYYSPSGQIPELYGYVLCWCRYELRDESQGGERRSQLFTREIVLPYSTNDMVFSVEYTIFPTKNKMFTKIIQHFFRRLLARTPI